MLRILFFVGLVFLIGLGFAWLADRPGNMVITFGGYQYQVTLMVAAVIVAAIVVAFMVTWWVLKSIWYSPYTITRYFRVRRRDRGYQALSTGMIAAGRTEDPNAGILDRLTSSGMGLVQVRPIGMVEGEDVPAIAARLDAAVQAGDYERALTEYDTLPAEAKAAGQAFIEKVRARLAADSLVDEALATALQN